LTHRAFAPSPTSLRPDVLALACGCALLVGGAGVAEARKDGKRQRADTGQRAGAQTDRSQRDPGGTGGRPARGAGGQRRTPGGRARSAGRARHPDRPAPSRSSGRASGSRPEAAAGGGGSARGSTATASPAAAGGEDAAATATSPVARPRPATSRSTARSTPAASTSTGATGAARPPATGLFAGTGLPSGLGALTDGRPVSALRSAAAERRDRGGASSSPIVRSVRQVVEVIPAAIWALIGLLATLMLVFAARSWLVGYRARRLADQREALLQDVGLLQKALLPGPPDQLPGVMVTAAYRPGRGPAAGGDFHDAFALDGDRLGLVVGSLSSGGRRALGLAALIRHTLRAYLEAGMQPRSALQVAAGVLELQLGADRAGVVVGVYDRGSASLAYAGAGHPPPVVLGPAAFEPMTTCAPPPLGSAGRVGRRQTTLHLPPGSVVCFHTEGLTAPSPGGAAEGRERLERALREAGPHADAEAVVDRVGGEDGAAPAADAAACLLRVAHAAEAPVADPGRRTEELELSREEFQGEAAGEFLAACGVPADRVAELVQEFRAAGARLGGAVLRVHAGSGEPEADLALCNVEILHGVRTPERPSARALA